MLLTVNLLLYEAEVFNGWISFKKMGEERLIIIIIINIVIIINLNNGYFTQLMEWWPRRARRWRILAIRKISRYSCVICAVTSFHDGRRSWRNIFQSLSRFSFFCSVSVSNDMAGLTSPLHVLVSLMSTCPRKGTENGWNLGLGTFVRNQVTKC